ncbi:hypothetical protein [Paenibacillus macerans]|uniref:hypothetical protein n=1 Tax=Paenibacillus macerans TaxID=44252 RepID=UPI003D31E479
MKKLVVFLIAITTAFAGITGSALASSSPQSDYSNVPKLDKAEQLEVESLLDELVAVRLEQSKLKETSLNGISTTTSIANLYMQDQNLVTELEEKGLKEERNILNEASAAQTEYDNLQILAGPPTWGPYPNVDILSYGEKTVTVSGKTYKIWITYAVPKSGGGAPLVKHYNAVKLINQPFEFSKLRDKVFDFLLQRAIGNIPYAEWTLYDYFWPEATSYPSYDTYDLSVSYASKMKYVWVENGTVWQLKASSNNVQTDETHNLRTYVNGSLKTIPKVKKIICGEIRITTLKQLQLLPALLSPAQ